MPDGGLLKLNLRSEWGRGTHDLADCLHQIIFLRFDCKITKPGCDVVSKDGLSGGTEEDVHVTTDTEQAKSPEKVKALTDSGTHTCHMSVPAEVTVYSMCTPKYFTEATCLMLLPFMATGLLSPTNLGSKSNSAVLHALMYSLSVTPVYKLINSYFVAVWVVCEQTTNWWKERVNC